MLENEILTKVKEALGITGEYQDNTLSVYIEDVKQFMIDGGVKSSVVNSNKAIGAIVRGVADLWNYGTGATEFSTYFLQRMSQLAYLDEEVESND